MKQQLHPAVAAVVICLLIAIVGFFIWKGTGVSPAGSGEKPPAMPANAGAQIQQAIGGSDTTAPKHSSGPAPVMPGGSGGMSAPNMGR